MQKATRLNIQSTSKERKKCVFKFNEIEIHAYEGETIATALLANGTNIFGYQASQPRAPFCGMGCCFECVVLVEEREVRACLHEIKNGLNVTTARKMQP